MAAFGCLQYSAVPAVALPVRAVNKAAVVVAGDGSSAGVAVLVVGGW
jgi:hypothetical protein